VAVLVGVAVAVSVGVLVAVLVGVAVAVLVGVLVAVLVGVDVAVLVGVAVAVLVGVAVAVLVAVAVAVLVAVAVAVLVGVAVAVLVGVAVAVLVGVAVAVLVGVGVAVGLASVNDAVALLPAGSVARTLYTPFTPAGKRKVQAGTVPVAPAAQTAGAVPTVANVPEPGDVSTAIVRVFALAKPPPPRVTVVPFTPVIGLTVSDGATIVNVASPLAMPSADWMLYAPAPTLGMVMVQLLPAGSWPAPLVVQLPAVAMALNTPLPGAVSKPNVSAVLAE
jgi:hypothetical protein